MKNIIPFILLFISLNMNAQDVKNILTSGKWYVTSTQENGSAPEEAESKTDEWIIFLPDGKTEEEHFGENTNSKWTYKEGNKTIVRTGQEEKIEKIIEITSQKLVVEQTEVGGNDVVIVTYSK